MICRTHNKPSQIEAKYNAHLIATAPELLEALQEAVELFDSAYKCMADGDNEGLYNTLANATSRTNFTELLTKALGEWNYFLGFVIVKMIKTPIIWMTPWIINIGNMSVETKR